MKTDIQGCSTCPVGQENYETFKSGRINMVQYDYRHTDGILFSTVALNITVARIRRDEWLKENYGIESND
jgi:hypothetical protein